MGRVLTSADYVDGTEHNEPHQSEKLISLDLRDEFENMFSPLMDHCVPCRFMLVHLYVLCGVINKSDKNTQQKFNYLSIIGSVFILYFLSPSHSVMAVYDNNVIMYHVTCYLMHV